MKDFIYRFEVVEYEKSYVFECSFVIKVESLEEIVEKGVFNIVFVKKKIWIVGGMERIGKEEICKENSEVIVEVIFDLDLKDYNVYFECLKIFLWYVVFSCLGL